MLLDLVGSWLPGLLHAKLHVNTLQCRLLHSGQRFLVDLAQRPEDGIRGSEQLDDLVRVEEMFLDSAICNAEGADAHLESRAPPAIHH